MKEPDQSTFSLIDEALRKRDIGHVYSTKVHLPTHPIRLAQHEECFNAAVRDAERFRPALSKGVIAVEVSGTIRVSLVVAADPQMSLLHSGAGATVPAASEGPITVEPVATSPSLKADDAVIIDSNIVPATETEGGGVPCVSVATQIVVSTMASDGRPHIQHIGVEPQILPQVNTSQAKAMEPAIDGSIPPSVEKVDQASTMQKNSLASAEAQAELEAKLVLGALDLAKSMVSESETETPSIEKIENHLKYSPDPMLVRRAFARARGTMRELTFATCKREIGGKHPIPSEALSLETFLLKNCGLKWDAQSGQFFLIPSSGDEGWDRLRSTYQVAKRIEGEREAKELFLIGVAMFLGLAVDVKVRIVEKVKTKLRSLAPVEVLNSEIILNRLRDKMTMIEEGLV